MYSAMVTGHTKKTGILVEIDAETNKKKLNLTLNIYPLRITMFTVGLKSMCYLAC